MADPTDSAGDPAALPCPKALERTARRAFASRVRYYEEEDEVIVHSEPFHVRLIYLSRRASRQTSRATFVQCRADDGEDAIWINTLQVAPDLQQQGLGREMVAAIEATARAIGRKTIVVYPLRAAVGFWQSLGFTAHQSMSRVLEKRLV